MNRRRFMGMFAAAPKELGFMETKWAAIQFDENTWVKEDGLSWMQ